MLSGWELPDRGALFVVTGPSGVGKSTLIRAMRATVPGIDFSVSATTRAPRPGERDGVDYHFLDEVAFEERVARGAFLEHATVYDRRYGTLAEPVFLALEAGRSILLDIDAQGADQVRSRWADLARQRWGRDDAAVSVFLLPPTLAALEARLRARGTEADEVIARRMQQVGEQIAGCGRFDYLVVNDHLETAQAAFTGIFLAELSRRARRDGWVRRAHGWLVS